MAGDRVTLHLPMVPELPITMLACARLGVIHSEVFEMLATLRSQLKAQNGPAVVPVATPGFVSPAPAPAPVAATPAAAPTPSAFVSRNSHKPLAKVATPDPNTGPVPMAPGKPLPACPDAPVPIQAILDQMSIDELRNALNIGRRPVAA